MNFRAILYVMNLIETVSNHLSAREMVRPGDTVICAVSGGADSICMLSVLREIGALHRAPGPFRVTCVHVHHAIRGAEADEDAAFVAEIDVLHQVVRVGDPARVLHVDARVDGFSLERQRHVA